MGVRDIVAHEDLVENCEKVLLCGVEGPWALLMPSSPARLFMLVPTNLINGPSQS